MVADISGTKCAFLTNRADKAVTVIDVSNPAAPAFSDALTSMDTQGQDWNLTYLSVGGVEHIFMSNYTTKAIFSIDVSNPASIALDEAFTDTYIGKARGHDSASIDGTEYVFCAADDNQRLVAIDISTPTALEVVSYIGLSEWQYHSTIEIEGEKETYAPILEITYSNWPNDQYPEEIVFPSPGKINLETYGKIKQYMEGVDVAMASLTAGDGNITLGADKWIKVGDETISCDSGGVVFSSIDDTTVMTVSCDTASDFVTITTACSAASLAVTGDLIINDTAYAGIKSYIDDNELTWAETSSPPSPADDEADIYMDSTNGNLMIKLRDDGLAGTKTGTLVNFAAL